MSTPRIRIVQIDNGEHDEFTLLSQTAGTADEGDIVSGAFAKKGEATSEGFDVEIPWGSDAPRLFLSTKNGVEKMLVARQQSPPQYVVAIGGRPAYGLGPEPTDTSLELTIDSNGSAALSKEPNS